METIKEAKQFLTERYEEGVTCPCCKQHVKLYKRKLYSTQMHSLIRLVRFDQRVPGYYHITKISATGHGGDFSKLEPFGLVVQQVNEDTKKKTSGMWRPTKTGIDFVYGRVKLPAFAKIYNGKVREFATEMVDIRQALGEKFDYNELMNGSIK